MTETHEQRVERLGAAVREEVLARYGISIGNEVSRAIVVAMIASDREAGHVTVPVSALKQALLVLPWDDLTRSEIQAALAAHEQEGR